MGCGSSLSYPLPPPQFDMSVLLARFFFLYRPMVFSNTGELLPYLLEDNLLASEAEWSLIKLAGMLPGRWLIPES